MITLIEKFRHREIKAKDLFTIKEIDKKKAYDFVRQYHYLKDAKFFAKFSYGLFIQDTLVGCASFSNPQGIASMKGWFGLTNDIQDILELSRLCMLPLLNGTNATSFLLGGSIKLLKKHNIRAVTTLADSNNHVGSIYQVCNFKYYGLSDKKTDFFSIDGKLNPRGETKSLKGVWLQRTRKHRYCYLLDKTLKVKYIEKPYPKKGETINLDCCGGSNKVYDNRFNIWYTCPRCVGELIELSNDTLELY